MKSESYKSATDSLHKKWRISSANVTLTKEICNEKFHFLCCAYGGDHLI